MLPITFPEKNFTYTKPKDMTDEQCSSLDVYKGVCGDGTPIIISKWQPSYEDIEAIKTGAPIYLSICGQGMPPVSLFTEDPFVLTT